MITVEKVITVNGRLENCGDWDYAVATQDDITNPYLGDGEPPSDWDYGIVITNTVMNPLPEGAIEEELDVFYDRVGTLRLVRDAASLELESRIASANVELSELLIDVQLGMAGPEEIERAKELRAFLKENPLS